MKWIIVVLCITFVTLYFTGRKSVHSELKIEVNPHKVWEVLMHTEDYKAWNPVMKVLSGTLQEGNMITYQFTQDADNASEIKALVKQMEPNELLNQTGGIPLILTFNHTYKLIEEDVTTRVIIHEEYKGIGVNFWNPQPVEHAYERLNKALKRRAESLN